MYKIYSPKTLSSVLRLVGRSSVRCGSLVAALLTSSVSYSLSADDFEFSGFGTVGMVMSDSDIYGYRRDLSFDKGVFSDDVDFSAISNLGLQLDSFVSKKSQVTLQVLLRDQTNTDIEEYITQAFYKYSISPSFDVREGRLPLALFALTEYREVNFAYPWAMTPTEAYGLFPLRALDGGDLSYTFRFDSSQLQMSLFAGKTETDVAAFENVETIKFKNALGVSLAWSDLTWEVRGNYFQLEFDTTSSSVQLLMDGINGLAGAINATGQLLPNPPYPEELWVGAGADAEALDINGARIDYMALSSRYYWGGWSLTGEVTRTDSPNILVPEVIGSYLSLAYAAGQSTFYGLVANTDSDAETFDDSGVSPLVYDPNSPLLDSSVVGPVVAGAFTILQPGYNALVDGYNQYLGFYASSQTSYSIGWRYDLKENVAINFQYSYTVIDEGGGTLWLSELGTTQGENVNTLFCNLSFTF